MNVPLTHAWLPRASCDDSCVRSCETAVARSILVTVRVALRVAGAVLLLPGLPLIGMALPPGCARVQRVYCRLMLRCFGVRVKVSGSPIRNLRGVLVVSSHTSWLDAFAIGAVLPGSFVARADMCTTGPIAVVARIARVIPIERSSLRRLPEVVAAIARRLRAGQTVVAFPEGTTWCGLASGTFYPAMFQAAIDAGRPVQPIRLTYHHADGSVSTAPAFVGEDTLLNSVSRLIRVRRTVVSLRVESLQLPGTNRRDLARRCQGAVRAGDTRVLGRHPGQGHALAA